MLSVQDLHKSYQVGKTTYEVLKGVSLEVAKGEFVAVMGPSGSGKTTLLNCISCYIPADSGSIRLGSQELARLDEAAGVRGIRQRVLLRVTPGRSSALAVLRLATLLIKVDLPTFGMPSTITRTTWPTCPFAA